MCYIHRMRSNYLHSMGFPSLGLENKSCFSLVLHICLLFPSSLSRLLCLQEPISQLLMSKRTDVQYITDALLVPVLTKRKHRAQQCPGLPTGLEVLTHSLVTTPHLEPRQKCDLCWGSSQVQGPNCVLVLARQLPCKQHHAQNTAKWQNAKMWILHVCSGNQNVNTLAQKYRKAALAFKDKNHHREKAGKKKALRKIHGIFFPLIPISPPKRQKQIDFLVCSKGWKARDKISPVEDCCRVHKFCNYHTAGEEQ